MLAPFRTFRALMVGCALSVCLAGAAGAGGADSAVKDQVSLYTGSNAVGYLQPLVNAFGATLNSSFSYSAYIPTSSFHVSLEVPVMGVIFGDKDRTFNATTESGFQPSTSATVPTVVGDGNSVTVPGNGGAAYSFPGGLDLHSFGLLVPQLRISSIAGTEALVRWAAYDDKGSDFWKLDLFGIGARHSISQYMGEQPLLDLAVGALWQSFKVGKNDRGGDFSKTDALLLQVQASKRAPLGFMTFEPYAGLSWEKLSTDLDYDDTNGDPVHLKIDGQNDMRFTFGAGLNFVAGQLWADYSLANTDTFSFGLALGNVGR